MAALTTHTGCHGRRLDTLDDSFINKSLKSTCLDLPIDEAISLIVPITHIICHNFRQSSKTTPNQNLTDTFTSSPGLAVLDGIHRLSPGALAGSVGRLLCDREAVLPDGTRIVQQARVDIQGSEVACRFTNRFCDLGRILGLRFMYRYR